MERSQGHPKREEKRLNFLAHLLLTKSSESLMVGSFLGDFVKGPINGDFPPGITAGIQHHRLVDATTDSHPDHQYLRTLFSPYRRRYAGVILDIAYDHILSETWSQFSDENMDSFINRSYEILENHAHAFPDRAKRFLFYMLREDALRQYGSMDGVRITLNRMANRGRYHPPLYDSHEEILELKTEIKERLFTLLPDLKSLNTPTG